MEGVLFYWIFWMFWIVTTFFMDKSNPRRTVYTVIILGAISLSNYSFTFFGISVSFTSLFLLLFVYLELAKWKLGAQLYFFVSAFILMLSSVSFQLFEMYDPVWVIFDRNWMFAIVISYIVLLLYEDREKRLYVLLFGAIHGDIVFSFAMQKYSFFVAIGSLRYFDVLALALLLLHAWYYLEKMSRYFEKYSFQLGKEKDKTS